MSPVNRVSRFELSDQNVLAGKVLRITPSGAIPADDPFQGLGNARCNLTERTTAATCQETFAWGLRNPFRLAFDPNDPGTRFYVNDAGQNIWEEIDLRTRGSGRWRAIRARSAARRRRISRRRRTATSRCG